MKYQGTLLATERPAEIKKFYRELLGLHVVNDFGANFTLTGGFSFQTRETWEDFIGAKPGEVKVGGRDLELYFETDDLDAFLEKLEASGAVCVHPPKTHAWGQTVVRFFDPDGHIVEVAESMDSVVVRFLREGMSTQAIVERTMLKPAYVERCRKKL